MLKINFAIQYVASMGDLAPKPVDCNSGTKVESPSIALSLYAHYRRRRGLAMSSFHCYIVSREPTTQHAYVTVYALEVLQVELIGMMCIDIKLV